MNCAEKFEWEMYVDGELPEARRQELQSHLAGCPACAGLVEGLRKEGDLFAVALAAIPVPPDLTAFIGRRLERARGESARWLRFFLPGLGLASMIAALLVAWLPLFEKVGTVLNLLGGRGLLANFLFSAGRIMGGLASDALQGRPALPALAVLVLCYIWMKLMMRKGGQVYA